MERNYNYTYKINQMNLENATFEVEYTPEDLNLTPVRLNLNLMTKYYKEIVDANNELVYSSQDDVPFELHLEYTINSCRPTNTWRNQYLMLENIDKLENANGSFIVDSTKDLVTYPNGFIVQIHNTGQPIL